MMLLNGVLGRSPNKGTERTTEQALLESLGLWVRLHEGIIEPDYSCCVLFSGKPTKTVSIANTIKRKSIKYCIYERKII